MQLLSLFAHAIIPKYCTQKHVITYTNLYMGALGGTYWDKTLIALYVESFAFVYTSKKIVSTVSLIIGFCCQSI